MKARRLLSALAVLLLVLLTGEWVARRWLQMPRSARQDPRFGWVQGPGARFVQSAEGWGEFRADADGFLDRPLPPPGRGVRAVLLGDSFGQGLQVLDRERFSEVAEHLMPGLHVLNTAAAGRSAFHHALLAPRLQTAFAPDLLLVQLDAGELTDIENSTVRMQAVAEFQPAAPREPERAGQSLAGLAKTAVRTSALLSYLRTRAEKLMRQERERLGRKLSGTKPDLRDLVALPATPHAEAVLDSLIGELQAANPNVVLVYVPNLDYFASPPRDLYPERRAWYHALATRRGLTLVDPTDAFLRSYLATGEPLHGFTNTRPAEGHVNARGHALMAAELVTALRTAGLAGSRHP